MFSNPIVNVALGLVLMYLMLSLFCTVINEFIATLTNLRSRYLKSAINWLLEDEDLKRAFHANGLVQSIQPRLGMLRKLFQGALKRRTRASAAPGAAPAKPAPAGSNWQASYIDGKTFVAALFSTLASLKQPLEPNALKAAALARTKMGGVLGDVLSAEIDAAGADVEKLKDSLARWFDKSMDQISGVYKRRLKWISLAVGIVVAFVLNANSITVAQQLWQNAELQQRVATLAAASAANPPPGIRASGETTGARPTGSTGANAASGASTSAGSAPDLSQSLGAVTQRYGALTSTFPMIGIGAAPWKTNHTGVDWLVYFFGLLFTAVALSLGAPFWFDLLSYIVKMRNDNDPPALDKKKKTSTQAAE